MKSIKSLELSIELWSWLIDNPDKSKLDHPTLPVKEWRGGCSLCEFAGEHCRRCPMLKCWPSPNGPYRNCLLIYSPWQSAKTLFDKSFFAAVLVEAFEERLWALKKKEALLQTYRIWKQIYDEELFVKPDTRYTHDCPCCQYAVEKVHGVKAMEEAQKHNLDFYMLQYRSVKSGQVVSTNCLEICPLKDLWPEGCEKEGSYYQIYDNTDYSPEYQPHAAKEIMEFTRNKLEEDYGVRLEEETNEG